MAYQPQNFDFQGQVPMAAIIDAYKNKAQQEYQMKLQQQQANSQKHQEVLQTINMASQLVQQGVQLSQQRQQKEAQKAYADILAQGADPFASGKMQTAVVGGVEQQVPTMGTRSQFDPSWRSEALATGQAADPETFQKATSAELAKSMFAAGAGTQPLSGRDIQQKNLILPNGQRVSLQLFETVPSQKYGTAVTWADLGGNEIDPATLAGAVEAPAPGYAVNQFGVPTIFERVGNTAPRPVNVATPEATPKAVASKSPEEAYTRLRKKAPDYAEILDKSVEKTTVNNTYIKDKVESVNASRYAKQLLEDPNTKETELRSVFTYIARAVEKGALTEADKAAFSEPLSLVAKGENMFMKTVKGKNGEIFKKSLVRLQKRLEQRGTAELRQKMNTEKLLTKKKLGKVWEPGLDNMYPSVDDLLISGSAMNPDIEPINLGEGWSLEEVK